MFCTFKKNDVLEYNLHYNLPYVQSDFTCNLGLTNVYAEML